MGKNTGKMIRLRMRGLQLLHAPPYLSVQNSEALRKSFMDKDYRVAMVRCARCTLTSAQYLWDDVPSDMVIVSEVRHASECPYEVDQRRPVTRWLSRRYCMMSLR